MANPAVFMQLPIMVRKSLYPDLDKDGMYIKEVPGDGNCLFAALADQLFQDYTRHPEVRKTVVDYMRGNRRDFESYAHPAHVEMRRPTRGQSLAAQQANIGDPFEVYMAKMSADRSYGGQPELVAFCRVFNRDVKIHRPPGQGHSEDGNLTSNDRRSAGEPVIVCHVAYGDESSTAHYDSVRQRDAIQPRRRLTPTGRVGRRPSTKTMQVQAVQRARPTLELKDIQEFLEKGKQDLDSNFHKLLYKDRPRSSSVSSSQRSSSSKRSYEPDDEPQPSSKKPDRRKSFKKRTVAVVSHMDRGTEVSFRIRLESAEPSTPASTQDTEYSSDAADTTGVDDLEKEYHVVDKVEDESDSKTLLDPATESCDTQPTPSQKARGQKGPAITTKKSRT